VDHVEAWFSDGSVTDAWGACFVSVIFKKGDPPSLDSYRGIGMGSVFGKLFSLVLHMCLDAWLEAQGVSDQGQAGFMDDKCTTQHIFVLKHLVDRFQKSPCHAVYLPKINEQHVQHHGVRLFH
jgi:hypothetical protein